MKRLICAVVALGATSVALGVSGSALAWGEREQGALVGAVIGALIAKESQRPVGYAQGYGYGSVGYGQVGPVGQLVCRQIPVVDQYGRHIGWTQQCAVRY